MFFPLLMAFTINMYSEQKKPMKILMVVACFPKIHDVCILNHITGLIDRGHDVRIYALREGNYNNLQENVVKYDLISRTMFELPSNLNDYDIVMFQLGHKLFDIREGHNFKGKFDIRKSHNFKGKIVVRLLGFDITAFLKENPHAYDYYFEACDLFMPVCEAFTKFLIQAGCNPDKIIVSHSSIDCSTFTFKQKTITQDDTINIISAGRFVEKKGFIYSIQAIADLIKEYPSIRYTIIGEGVLKKECQDLIKKLGVADKIKLDSWYSHDKYIPILQNSHIFVLTSVTAQNNDQEGIPNVLIEAMATGAITVASDHSGNSELISHKKSGFLVPERNSKAIYNTIKYIIKNYNKLLPMQQAALEKVYESFEMEKENDKLETILYNLLA